MKKWVDAVGQQFPFIARIYEVRKSVATNVYLQMAKLVTFTPLPAEKATDGDDELDGDTLFVPE